MSFNDSLTDYVSQSLKKIQGKKEIWAVGERIQLLLSDSGFNVTEHFSVPGSVHSITPLVGEMLLDELNNTYHRTRQSSIDEELFDVVSGFEALKGNKRQKHK